MAHIRVMQGAHGHNFMAALNRAQSGDTLVIAPGAYDIGPIYLNRVQVVGEGAAGAVVLLGKIEARGDVLLSNLTIRAADFNNAISIKTAGATMRLDGCTIHADAAGRYPAVFVGAGTLMMRRTAVHQDKSIRAVQVDPSGELHATESGLGWLALIGAKATLTDAHVYSVTLDDRSRLVSRGTLQLMPAQDKRALAVSGESSARISRMKLVSDQAEALCEASLLAVGELDLPRAERLLVIVADGGVIQTTSPLIQSHDRDAHTQPTQPAPVEQTPAREPATWRWLPGTELASSLGDQLRPGDTVLVEEGQYRLDEFDGCAAISVNLLGTGRAEHTVIQGGLRVNEHASVSLSNLSLEPELGVAGLVLEPDSGATLREVVIRSSPQTAEPLIEVGLGATLDLSGGGVGSDSDTYQGVLRVAGGRLTADQTYLGWVNLTESAQATITNSTCLQLRATEGAQVTVSQSIHLAANGCNQRQLLVEGGATIRGDELTTDDPEFEALVESTATLILASAQAAEAGQLTICQEPGSRIEVESPQLQLIEWASAQTSQPEVAQASGPTSVTQDRDLEPAVTPDEPDLTPPAEVAAADPMAAIAQLTGLGTVKEQIRDFLDQVEYDRLRGVRTDAPMHSLFLGNPGTGKTTVARLLGKALYAAGAVSSDVFVEVGRRDLVSENLGGSAKLTQKVLERAHGGVLFIDEAYSLYQEQHNEFGQEAVDTLLTYLENHRNEIVVIFAGYTDRMQDFLAMNVGLASRVPHRFDFEDYTAAEIAQIGHQSLVADAYTVNRELYDRVVAGVYQRSADRSNGRWARNFNNDLIKHVRRRVMRAGLTDPQSLSTIVAADLYAVAGADPAQGDTVTSLLDELDAMIGLAPVKQWVRSLVNRVQYNQRRMEVDGTMQVPNYHVRFTGNPGTGKTTVAQLVAQLFHALGILSSPTVKQVDRSDLVGRYIGETEQRTSRVLDEAMGGVLFVDEAYQLYIEDLPRDFGRQAIETLLPRLENDREKFVAIFAGYTAQMQTFVEANPGLTSRIPTVIEFPDYTPDEVAQIVVARLGEQWQFDADRVRQIAADAYAAETQDRSNGRWARNLVTRLEDDQIEYLMANNILGEQLKQIPDQVLTAFADRLAAQRSVQPPAD